MKNRMVLERLLGRGFEYPWVGRAHGVHSAVPGDTIANQHPPQIGCAIEWSRWMGPVHAYLTMNDLVDKYAQKKVLVIIRNDT